MAKSEGPRYGGVSSEAVAARTSRTWEQWTEALDAAGARDLDHKGIVALLAERFGVAGWWGQMVTVGYEQARGTRQAHQMPDGFAVSASKTFNAPVDALYRAWADPGLRERWLPGVTFEITTGRPGKSLRIRWGEGGSRVDVSLYPKGERRGQLGLQHSRLVDAAAVEAMRAFWKERLEALRAVVEG